MDYKGVHLSKPYTAKHQTYCEFPTVIGDSWTSTHKPGKVTCPKCKAKIAEAAQEVVINGKGKVHLMIETESFNYPTKRVTLCGKHIFESRYDATHDDKYTVVQGKILSDNGCAKCKAAILKLREGSNP